MLDFLLTFKRKAMNFANHTCCVLQTIKINPADLNAELLEHLHIKPDYTQGDMYLVIAGDRRSHTGEIYIRLVPRSLGEQLEPGNTILISVPKHD